MFFLANCIPEVEIKNLLDSWMSAGLLRLGYFRKETRRGSVGSRRHDALTICELKVEVFFNRIGRSI